MTSNQRRLNSRHPQMTSQMTSHQITSQMTSQVANNSVVVRHIDVSDVSAADFRLLDGHVTPSPGGQGQGQGQGQVKVTVSNGVLCGPQRTGESAETGRRRRQRVDEDTSEVDDCSVDDVTRQATDVTELMSCDARGCGRHDNGFISVCTDDRCKVSASTYYYCPQSTVSHDLITLVNSGSLLLSHSSLFSSRDHSSCISADSLFILSFFLEETVSWSFIYITLTGKTLRMMTKVILC